MGMILLKMALAGCVIDAGIMGYKGFKKTSKTGSAFTGKPKEIKKYLGKTGIQLSKKIQLNEKSMYEHIGIFGKTGAAKSAGIYIPNLLSNNLCKSSLIINDSSGELYEITSWYQENICKRKILVYDPLHPEKSIGINPLAICRDITDIRNLAQVLISNATLVSPSKSSSGAEWEVMASSILTAALLYCKHKDGKQCNITSALDLIISNSNIELEMLFMNSTTEVIDAWNIFKTSEDAKGAASSIKVTMASALQIFLDYKIVDTTTRNEFNPIELRETPTALYIINSETKVGYMSPLMAVIYSQLIDFNLEYFDKNKDSLPIFNFWDEFGNMGMLPDFGSTVTAARKRKFSLNICIHDMCQLFRIYGENLTKSMLNNLTTKVVLPGISEATTLEYISFNSGETEIEISNESKVGDKTTVSHSKQKKRLYTPNEVRCLNDETCIIIINNKQVVADKLNLYFKNKIYNNRIVKQYL